MSQIESTSPSPSVRRIAHCILHDLYDRYSLQIKQFVTTSFVDPCLWSTISDDTTLRNLLQFSPSIQTFPQKLEELICVVCPERIHEKKLDCPLDIDRSIQLCSLLRQTLSCFEHGHRFKFPSSCVACLRRLSECNEHELAPVALARGVLVWVDRLRLYEEDEKGNVGELVTPIHTTPSSIADSTTTTTTISSSLPPSHPLPIPSLPLHSSSPSSFHSLTGTLILPSSSFSSSTSVILTPPLSSGIYSLTGFFTGAPRCFIFIFPSHFYSISISI